MTDLTKLALETFGNPDKSVDLSRWQLIVQGRVLAAEVRRLQDDNAKLRVQTCETCDYRNASPTVFRGAAWCSKLSGEMAVFCDDLGGGCRAHTPKAGDAPGEKGGA